MVYAHNGGKFDFFFMLTVLENPVRLINSRIVSARLGIHELRDSWAIMPFPLAKYKKTEIDYGKFEVECRETHREEILNYLHDDCCDLMDLVTAFVKRFGFRLTIAGTAMHELQQIHPQEFCNENHDRIFRPYYFGGRVECFESGVHAGTFEVFDVNSMYPAVMSSFDHPIGPGYLRLGACDLDGDGWIEGYPGCMYFCTVEGENLGALPRRNSDGNGGLSFADREGIFDTTSHELRAAIELGKFRVARIISALIPHNTQRFDQFVSKFADEKKAAKKAGDKISEIFAKLIMNSAYGKFGQDPERFKDYMICIRGMHMEPDTDEWELETSAEHWTVWSKPAPNKRYFDVAIAASVTSAARAVLMRGIVGATRPMYCDTDSIICEKLNGVKIDEYELGAWKKEAHGVRLAVAGKKLYTLFDEGHGPFRPGKSCDVAVKWACKGSKLLPAQIEQAALGDELVWSSDAPNFPLTGGAKFVTRRIRKTA